MWTTHYLLLGLLSAPPVATTLDLRPSSATIAPAGTRQFTASVEDQYGAPMLGESITWESSDEGVATINGSGLATGVSVGTTTISATAGSASDTSLLTVADASDAPPSRELNGPAVRLGLGF